MTNDRQPPLCTRCGAHQSRRAYEVRTAEGRRLRCLRCALLHAPLLRRSLVIAMLVGTLIVAINQGNVLIAGDFPAALYWKIPLTYCVPFFVATTAALLNSRSEVP